MRAETNTPFRNGNHIWLEKSNFIIFNQQLVKLYESLEHKSCINRFVLKSPYSTITAMECSHAKELLYQSQDASGPVSNNLFIPGIGFNDFFAICP